MTISNLTKMLVSYPNGKKTLMEKEKLLIMSNFCFSHSVFKRLVSQGRQKVSLCGNGLKLLPFTKQFLHYMDSGLFVESLTHYHTIPHFVTLMIYSYGKQCEKRRNCFLLFLQCFLLYMVLIFHFKCTIKGRLQSV